MGKGEGSCCLRGRFPFIIHTIPFLQHTFFYIAMLVFFLLSILHLLFCIFLCPFYIKISMQYHENPFALQKQEDLKSGSTAPWNCYSHCDGETSPWNHFHVAVVSLFSLRTTRLLRGIASTASRFHYPHCNRPNPLVESLPQRRSFTILTAADQTAPWNRFHGVTVSLSSLRPTKPLHGITSTASGFHYPHCHRPNSVVSLPRRQRLTNLPAAAKHSPLELLARSSGSTTQDFPSRNGVYSISSGHDFPSLPLFSSQSSRVNRQACVLLDYAKFHPFSPNHIMGCLSSPLLALLGPNLRSRIPHPPGPLSFFSLASHLSTSNAPRGKFHTKDVRCTGSHVVVAIQGAAGLYCTDLLVFSHTMQPEGRSLSWKAEHRGISWCRRGRMASG